MLIDSHAHLDDKRFDIDREKIIKNMENDGIEIILHPAADMTSSVKAVNTAQEKKNNDGMRSIIHCYSGSYEMALEFIKLGFLISIAGPVTFKNSKKVKEVVKKLPLKHLLIETDSPYLAPEPKRGRRNEPAYVRYVASQIGEIKGIPFNKVAEATSENFINFFNL